MQFENWRPPGGQLSLMMIAMIFFIASLDAQSIRNEKKWFIIFILVSFLSAQLLTHDKIIYKIVYIIFYQIY